MIIIVLENGDLIFHGQHNILIETFLTELVQMLFDSNFSLWYRDYSGTEFINIMLKLEKVLYIHNNGSSLLIK